MVLHSFFGPSPFFSFLILYIVGRTPWTGDEPVARPLPTNRTTQTQNKCTQTSMSQMGFEPTTPVLEQVKTVHVLDRAATVIGTLVSIGVKWRIYWRKCLTWFSSAVMQLSSRRISDNCTCSNISGSMHVSRGNSGTPFLWCTQESHNVSIQRSKPDSGQMNVPATSRIPFHFCGNL
jgi:hypothetical protein